MLRLFGFLIGSATSIAVILLVTGLPEFHLKDPQIDQQRFDAAVEKLMARKQEVEQVAHNVTENTAELVESVQEALTDSGDNVSAAPIAAESVADNLVNDLVYDDIEATELVLSAPHEDASTMTDSQWYSFWNPFRSKIAANGFVTQLEKVTGLDYRVVKVKTGVYEVAFAYNDDDERRRKLSQISMATGLDLPDS